MKYVRLANKKGKSKKNQTKLPQPSVTDPWSGREENVNFLHLLVIYLERQEILLRGNFKSQTSAVEQTQ